MFGVHEVEPNDLREDLILMRKKKCKLRSRQKEKEFKYSRKCEKKKILK